MFIIMCVAHLLMCNINWRMWDWKQAKEMHGYCVTWNEQNAKNVRATTSISTAAVTVCPFAQEISNCRPHRDLFPTFLMKSFTWVNPAGFINYIVIASHRYIVQHVRRSTFANISLYITAIHTRSKFEHVYTHVSCAHMAGSAAYYYYDELKWFSVHLLEITFDC